MKTYKRETAVVLLAFLGFMAWKAAQVDPVEVFKVLVWPIMTWAGLAFGVDWYSKQKPAI